MAEIAVPNDDLTYTRLSLRTPSQVNRSVWTGRRKVVGLAGTEVWTVSVGVDLIATETEERTWRAFLFGLAGPENWFRLPLPCNSHIGPKPTVAAGAGDGYSLPLEGMQPNARILRAGQFFTVPLPSSHHRTVMLTTDLRTDGDGKATAYFRPALNELPVEGATIETVDPFLPVSPVESVAELGMSEGVSGFAFDVEEAFGGLLVGEIPTFDSDADDFTFDME